MKDDTFDRRLGPRVYGGLALTIQPLTSSPDEKVMTCEVVNLSRSGLCFRSTVGLSLVKRYEIHLLFTDRDVMHTTVRLMWEKKEIDHILYGLSFSQMSMENQERIVRYLAEENQRSVSGAIKDRRIQNRRVLNSAASGLNHRQIERRADVRLRHSRGIKERFLSEDLKNVVYRRVVITGVGIVSPIGIGKNEFLNSLRGGVSGIGAITRFDASDMVCRLGGEIKNFKSADYIPAKKARQMDLATQFGFAAAKLALADARIDLERENKRRIGVSMGSVMAGLGFIFQQHDGYAEDGIENIHPYTIAAGSPNACSGEIAGEIHAKGPCASYSQGCTSSANAITYAYEQIRKGGADVMVAGGCEAPFTRPIYAAFCRSGLMTQTNGDLQGSLPRPFSTQRGGIVLAEAGAVLVMEDLDHARARGATIYAEMIGSASTCDGFDMMHPQTDGVEAARAVQLAIESGAKTPDDISVIFTHAPGSRDADKVEMKALSHIFKERTRDVYIANIKSFMGYCQGATTAVEVIAACLCLQAGLIPPVINTDSPEIALNMGYEDRYAELRVALLNCFGFGGKNMCLVLQHISS